MKKIATFLAWLALTANVVAQTFPGELPAGNVVGNPTASTNVGRPASITSMFDQAYCNTVGYLVVRFTGAWTCSKGSPANPVWWGADPTGSADSAAAFTSALAASTFIQFPAGKFKFLSTISYIFAGTPASLQISGAGADNTILFWPSGNGLSLSLSAFSHSFHIRDVTFSSGAAPGGTGLNITGTINGVLAQNDVINTTFRGDDYGVADYWATAVNVAVTNDIAFTGVNFIGLNSGGTGFPGTGTGVAIAGNASFFAFNYYFTNTIFNQLNVGILSGSYTQGIYVSQSSFGGQTGISVINGLSGTLCCMGVDNTQFANKFGISIATNFNDYTVSNSLFFIPANGRGINIGTNGGGTISGNLFTPAPAAATSGNIAVALGTTGSPFQNTTIQGNTFYAMTIGLDFLAGSSGGNAQGNAFTANSTAISNSGTGNVIANNIGYNPVGYTAGTSTGISASTISAGASPETHYVTQSANFNAVVAKCTDVACGTSTNICTVPSATVPCVLQLGPNENYKVTWATTQPTYTKDIH